MTSRVDAIQIAIPRAVTDAQQEQHVAARQPAVAQEQVAATVRDDARAREQRPEALQHRDGGRDSGRVRGELVDGIEERHARRHDRQGRRPAVLQDHATQPAADATASDPSPSPGPPPTPDPHGRGTRVDLRL